MRIFYPKIPVINNTLFVKQMYVLYESRKRDVRVSYFVSDSPFDPCTSGSYYQLRSRIYAEHAIAYAMAAGAGVVKAILINRSYEVYPYLSAYVTIFFHCVESKL